MRISNLFAGLLLGSMALGTQATEITNANLDAGWNPPGNNGQINGAFAIEQNIGTAPIELGLRAQQRRDGPVTPDGGTGFYYTVQPGADIDNLPPATNLAWWNFDWSAAYGPGIGSLDSLKLGIFDGLSGQALNVIDILALIDTLPNPQAVLAGAVIQDSWNPTFAGVGIPGFDLNDTSFAYWFVLAATDNGAYASVHMCVRSASNEPCNIDEIPELPEPGTLAIFGLGLGALAISRRRRS